MAFARLRGWWAETHGVRFELVRHFLARSFDSEMVTVPGEWLKFAIGLGAALFSAGYLAIDIYWKRYASLQSPDLSNRALYHQGIREDMLSFVMLAMVITAVATSLQWQSLFPSVRDCMALAGLPVRMRQIFLARFTSLLVLFASFVVVLTLPWAVLFGGAASGPWQENSTGIYIAANFAATGGACVFVFFVLLSVQGLLLNLLPARMFVRVSLAVQAVVFMATLGALPLEHQPAGAAWWPPVWFLRLWEAIVAGRPSAARPAIIAVAAPAALSVLSYLLSYRRYRKLLVEAPRTASMRVARRVNWPAWIRDSNELAAFSFIWKTLLRSRSHRLILMAFIGLAAGWVTKSALDIPRPSLRDEGLYGLVGVLAPLAFAMLVTAGLRYLFSLPVALQANWLFRTTDKRGRGAWLAAVERFVVCCAIAPIFLASVPVSIAIWGGVRALAATLLGFFASLLWFEALFRNWSKLPFTCSYLPGKKPFWLTFARYLFGSALLAPIAELILASSGEPLAFATVFTFEVAVWWWLRARRRAAWAAVTLVYEETDEAAVSPLHFEPAEERLVSSAPQREAPLFAGSLVASRGLLPEAWAEEIAEERRHPSLLLDTFLEDVRYGFRLIRRSPLLSAVVVLTLTVGIGINASVFTVVNSLALRPHVYHAPDSFVRVVPYARAQNQWRPVSYPEYSALANQARSLRQLAAYTMFQAMIGDEDSTGVNGLLVSCNFFAVDGTERATLGRVLVPQDCDVGTAAPVAVISESIWHSRFASDPRAIGRTIRVNNHPLLVIGVVPDRTSNWTRVGGIWVPYTAELVVKPNAFAQESFLWLALAGRLAPGYSRSQAEAELQILEQRQDSLNPGRRTGVRITDGSWAAELDLADAGRNLMLFAFFFGAFHLVLFISCANVATLLLSRAAARRREIAVRLSLGAPRVRLVRMLITESFILAAAAGAISLYLAEKVPHPLYRMVASRAPDFPMPTDWRTFVYVFALVMVTGFLAGLAPALESLKLDLTGTLKGSGGALTGGATGTRVRGWLVAAQVAMSMVLVVEAGLFGQSENRALRADPGYLPQRVVVAPIQFPDTVSPQTAQVRLEAMADRVRAIPGVHSVSFSDDLPLLRPETLEIVPPLRHDALQPVDVFLVSAHFLETMGIPVLKGRDFQDSDTSGVVISNSLARLLFWRQQNPVGQTLTFPDGAEPIIGVARDIEPLRVGGSDNPPVYRRHPFNPRWNAMSVRFDSGAAKGAPAVRAAIHQADPNSAVVSRLLQSWIDEVTEVLWNVAALIAVLGVVATVLTTTGIYGAVSFAVNQKTRDLGIRVALGASRLDIVREVFLSGGKPVIYGLLLGLWFSVAAATGLRESVKGSPIRLDTTEPLLYGGTLLLIAIAAGVAMLGPARRGSRSDPLEALRCE